PPASRSTGSRRSASTSRSANSRRSTTPSPRWACSAEARLALIHFVRHGASTGGPGDPGLSPEGAAQAEAVSTRLATLPITAVFSSPLRRARETAAIIARAVGPDVGAMQVDERLRERA